MFWGWWGWSSHRGRRGGFGMFGGWLLIFGLIWLFTGGRSMGWVWWFILPTIIFSVLPAIIRSVSQNAQGVEKRKRSTFEEEQKPKREPRYILGDDGELIPVEDDEKPKHQGYL